MQTGPRRDHLKQLRAFCEVVRLGSISQAAEGLGVSQSAVSNLVRTLEEDLGTALFLRHGGRVQPTSFGRHLNRVAIPLVEKLQRLPELFEDNHFGESVEKLRIGAGQFSAGFLLPDLLQRFQARFPRIRIELQTGTGAERLQWLRSFRLDVVIAAVAAAPAEIEFHPLVQANAVVITPQDHPLASRKRVSFKDIARHPMVVPAAGHYVRQVLEVVFSLHGVRPIVAVEVTGWDAIINYVAVGSGVAIVPDLSVDPREPVRKVAIAHAYQLRKYGVAVRRDQPIGLAAKRFVEFVKADPGSAERAP